MRTITMALAMVPLLAPFLAGAVRPAEAGRVVVAHCQVFLIDDVRVPAQEAGPLAGVLVKEGEPVKQGQLLAQIDDRQAVLQKQAAELERDDARARAEDDIEIRFADKSLALAETEYRQDLEINSKSPGAVPETEVRRKKLAWERAQLQVQRSRLDRKLAEMTALVQSAALSAADEAIRRRRIVAPFDGVVIEIAKAAAEWVHAGEAVLRVARMDQLKVEGFVDGSQYNASDLAGRRVTVEIERARGSKENLEGQVVYVYPIVQAGNKYRVRADVQNRRDAGGQPVLYPGMTATMFIHLQP